MDKSTLPVTVEIVAYAPTAFYHCTHCEVVWRETDFSRGLHEEQVRSALPSDLLDDYQNISDWVRHISRQFCGLIQIKVIDAASLEGAWKTLRHGIRGYPAVIVGGRRYEGAAFDEAEAAVARELARRPAQA